MLQFVGSTCKALRVEQRVPQSVIAIMAQASVTTVQRFEMGANWPPSYERFIDAYAAACEVEPLEIWTRALKAYTADGGQPVAEDLRELAAALKRTSGTARRTKG